MRPGTLDRADACSRPRRPAPLRATSTSPPSPDRGDAGRENRERARALRNTGGAGALERLRVGLVGPDRDDRDAIAAVGAVDQSLEVGAGSRGQHGDVHGGKASGRPLGPRLAMGWPAAWAEGWRFDPHIRGVIATLPPAVDA